MENPPTHLVALQGMGLFVQPDGSRTKTEHDLLYLHLQLSRLLTRLVLGNARLPPLLLPLICCLQALTITSTVSLARSCPPEVKSMATR